MACRIDCQRHEEWERNTHCGLSRRSLSTWTGVACDPGCCIGTSGAIVPSKQRATHHQQWTKELRLRLLGLRPYKLLPWDMSRSTAEMLNRRASGSLSKKRRMGQTLISHTITQCISLSLSLLLLLSQATSGREERSATQMQA